MILNYYKMNKNLIKCVCGVFRKFNHIHPHLLKTAQKDFHTLDQGVSTKSIQKEELPEIFRHGFFCDFSEVSYLIEYGYFIDENKFCPNLPTDRL